MYIQQFGGYQSAYSAGAPSRAQTRQFAFDGGAATYFGTAILGFLITVFTLGICYPFAVVLHERWRVKHSYIEGRQLVFIGSATRWSHPRAPRGATAVRIARRSAPYRKAHRWTRTH